MTVRIKRLRDNAVLPTYGSACAAGADLYVPTGDPVDIPAHTTVMIPLGFAIEIPDGYCGLVMARSGIATKRGLAPANKVGLVDSDYRGEVCVAVSCVAEPMSICLRPKLWAFRALKGCSTSNMLAISPLADMPNSASAQELG